MTSSASVIWIGASTSSILERRLQSLTLLDCASSSGTSDQLDVTDANNKKWIQREHVETRHEGSLADIQGVVIKRPYLSVPRSHPFTVVLYLP